MDIISGKKNIVRGIVTLVMIVTASAIAPAVLASGEGAPGDEFMVLSYHDIPRMVDLDNYGVDQNTFVQTIEYLRTHGYHFIGVDDVIAAHEGRQPLPERAVLLTFDDAYRSFYEFVFPLLEQYQYPCTLAVVSGWIDSRPPDVEHELMTWDQLKEAASSRLVEVASHTHRLHHGLLYNPQGNKAAAAANRRYDPEAQTYETEDEYRQRLREDFISAKQTLQTRLGVTPRIMVWPYGKYNAIAREEAGQAGFGMTFALNDRIAGVENLSVIDRIVIYKNPSIQELIREFKRRFQTPEHQRIMQVDLDLIYDPDPARTEENLGWLLDRAVEMKIGTVYLQAFADPEGTGNISSVYFPNRLLPMRADLFNRVAHQLKSREIVVYAWMPMLSIVPPDKEEFEALRVRELTGEGPSPSGSWYQRLSPFSSRVHELLRMLYEDLAINAWIDGVVFQDDGYLNEDEDFHPDALPYYREIIGEENCDPGSLSPEERRQWTEVKTQKLIELTQELREVVLRYRPEARFARTLYAPVVTDPESKDRFCQDYPASLDAYDYVVIMAYPRMEEIERAEAWFKTLVDAARAHPGGIEKTVFKVQTYDWNRKQWIDASTVNQWLRCLAARGAHHLAYYPDNYLEHQPDKEVIRRMMSVEDFPFLHR